MIRLIICLQFLCSLPGSAYAQHNRTDKHGVSGIYAGKFPVALASKGFKPELYEARLVVYPDERSMILTMDTTAGVISTAIRGKLSGNTFKGQSKGRFTFGLNYSYGENFKIMFHGEYADVWDTPINRLAPDLDPERSTRLRRVAK
jgi:hypothetical protein